MEDYIECVEATVFLPGGPSTGVQFRPGLKGEPKSVILHESGVLEADWGVKGARRLYINVPMIIRIKE